MVADLRGEQTLHDRPRSLPTRNAGHNPLPLPLLPPAPSPQPPAFSPLISITSVCGVDLVPQVLDTCVGFGIPVAGLVGGGYSKDTQVGRVDSGRWDVHFCASRGLVWDSNS